MRRAKRPRSAHLDQKTLIMKHKTAQNEKSVQVGPSRPSTFFLSPLAQNVSKRLCVRKRLHPITHPDILVSSKRKETHENPKNPTRNDR